MNWLHFVAAAVLSGSVMSFVGAPIETVIAGVTLAGGLTYIQKLVLRK
jgi:hypothetical protein